ncbi:MAG: hypothetical protein Q9201_002098 [Fulgogasparrea decipioides]
MFAIWRLLTLSLLGILAATLTTPSQSENVTFSFPPSLTAPPTASVTCYIPGGNIKHPVVLSDCYKAVRLVLTDPAIVEPKHYNRANVPYFRQYQSCLFVLDTTNPRDDQEFLLIRAAYVAAELVQPCVARQKMPLGGRTELGFGDFFTGVVGQPLDAGGNWLPAVLKELKDGTAAKEVQ